jgi:hypothetical protein
MIFSMATFRFAGLALDTAEREKKTASKRMGRSRGGPRSSRCSGRADDDLTCAPQFIDQDSDLTYARSQRPSGSF